MGEHTVDYDAPAQTRDYCPACGARDREDECATPSGRDHAGRRDFRWGWDSALRAIREGRIIPPDSGRETGATS